MSQRPAVGVAIIIWRGGKAIFYERLGPHGHGKWSVPGGHLELGESWEECARREAMEEVGVEIKNVRFLAVTNDYFEEEGKHSVSIWLESDWAANEPRSMEPEKVSDVEWRRLDDLPSPLFEPCWTHLKQTKPELFAKS
jgi:8-oxo-dGTP diphosphatase